jgi:hypothetical protein
MLSLSEPLHHTWQTDAGEFEIDLSFDNVLRWYTMAGNDDLDNLDKVRASWLIFIGDGALAFDSEADWDTAIKAVDGISQYIAHDVYEDPEESDESNSASTPKLYSFDQDAEAIYASFIFDYNIDLVEQQGKLRWEKFVALFNNLSAKSPLQRIVSIRQMDTSKLEGQDLADAVQAQQYYALEKSVSQVDDAMSSIFGMLMDQAKGQE